MSKKLNANILKIKNLLISKKAIGIIAGGITFACAFSMNKVNDERPVKLSKDIYYDCVLDDGEIEPCYYLEKDDIGTYSLENEHILDLSITKRNLENVKRISVHAFKTDFNDLKLLPNLEEIEISGFGDLTEEDKKNISRHHKLKRIIIDFDTSIFNTECHDMSWINDDVEIVLKKEDLINTVFDRLNHEDMFYLFVYNTAYKINKINNDRINLEIFNPYTRKDLERWNKIMMDTVDSFGFTKDTTEEEKIIKIVEYVTDTIEYDQDVIAGVEEGILVDKVADYNYDVLRSLLDNDSEEVNGVCCNYAALTAILAYYSDVDLDYISGYYSDCEFGHAWCQYTKDDNTYIIDSTFLDDNDLYNEYKENSKIYGIEEYKDELINIIFNDKPYNYNIKRKKNYNDIEYIKRNKYVEYMNTGADKFNRDISDRLNRNYAIVAGFAILSYLTSELIDKKQKQLKKEIDVGD